MFYFSFLSKYLKKFSTSVQFSFFFYGKFIYLFISWRLITLQYCSGFCHTLTRISPGFTLTKVSSVNCGKIN